MNVIAWAKRYRRGIMRISPRFWLPLARTLLARSMQTAAKPLPTAGSVQRVVFVCHGNIMRSAFAHAVWHEVIQSSPPANDHAVALSAGTDARAGRAAHPLASTAADKLGVSLKQHLATPLKDTALCRGDLLVGFDCENEVQLRALASPANGVQVLMLGDLTHPGTMEAEIRDPWGTSEAQTVKTFERIRSLLWALDAQLRPTPAYDSVDR